MGVVRSLLQGNRLRYVVIVTHVLSILLSGCIFFPLGSVSNHFESGCILYADLIVDILNSGNSTSIVLDTSQSVWGSVDYCNYCTYCPVTVSVSAIIWTWLYLQMTSLQKKNEALCYLLISSMLHAVLSVVILVSSIILTFGMSTFCSKLEVTIKHSMTCEETENATWSTEEGVYYFYQRIKIAQVCSWLLTVVLLVQCILAGYFGGKLVMEKNFEEETNYKPFKGDDTFTYDNKQNCYDEGIIQEETGSIIFHHDIESSTTMKEQYNKL